MNHILKYHLSVLKYYFKFELEDGEFLLFINIEVEQWICMKKQQYNFNLKIHDNFVVMNEDLMVECKIFTKNARQ